ncbi:MAG TPA: lipase maturation factor family protein [Acidobacteriota bacterium]
MEPERPLLLFDGDCGFCRRWVEYWRARTAGRVDFEPLQEHAGRPDRPPAQELRAAVHLIEPDGRISRGAEAVFRTLRCAPGQRHWLWIYRRVPSAAFCFELGYRWIARHRSAADRVTILLWGRDLRPSTYGSARALLLRLLGLVFLIAFVSLWSQIDGLIGSRGLLPAGEFLQRVEQGLGAARFWRLPTLLWLSPSDGFVHALCAAGTLLSLGLIAGLAAGPILLLLWLLYLSLLAAGQDFLSFQWDVLLLESAVMALFIAPWRLLPRPGAAAAPGALGWLPLRFLLFKLMLLSGVTKLLSGDPAWRQGSALPLHYETQPLPTWIGWYVFQLPDWFHRLSWAIMFAVELAVPFLIFAPRRLRHAAAGIMIVFQALIALTGNDNFFNLLTAALCAALLDDRLLGRMIPARWRSRPIPVAETMATGRGSRTLVAVSTALVLLASGMSLLAEMVRTHQNAGARAAVPGWLDGSLGAGERYLLSWGEPLLLGPIRSLHSINGYGLFRVMTVERPEIIIEGSRDGRQWKEYGFRWKPGDPKRRPRFVQPHQPRLDWQMWFAALGPQGQRRWLIPLCGRLLEGEPAVLELMGENPFPDRPPQFVRLAAYDYRFTDLETRRRTGAWWRRSLRGYLTGPLALSDLRGPRP